MSLMLTIFSCPKAFRGQSGPAQRNAIQSWVRIAPKPEIILLGDEEGTTETAKEFGIKHVPSIERNDFGTPLVKSIFKEAERAASREVMCYLNADILLLSDFMDAVKTVHNEMPRSLMVGRRWNLDVSGPIEFKEGWEQGIKEQVARRGKLVPHFFIDYFIFPKGVWGEIPTFAIGRPAWDNWMIFCACQLGLPVVDLTPAVTVIHQNHDYSHHPQGWTGAMRGEESRRNITLAGEVAHVHSLLDAGYCLTPRGLKRKFPPYYVPFYLYRTLVVRSASYPFLRPIVRLIKKLGYRIGRGNPK
jgi:hypothetical protein